MKLPGYVKEIIEIYHRAGYEAFVVGGCVRDYLLGKEPHDYDIATNALPEVTIQLFDHVILTGLKHGTVTILSNEPVEVTTFRLESEYKDHRHPEAVRFVNTIEEDLSRRDFTVNAMAYNDIRGLIDPFHGQIGNYQFGLYLKENNRLIGDIFIEIDGHTTFTLGYTLDSVYWSKGYASEALKSVFKAMHETYSFKICLCHVYEDNIKSIRLLERNGFDKIHKSWFYQDVLYRKMLNK